LNHELAVALVALNLDDSVWGGGLSVPEYRRVFYSQR
jgi:hypothetical protein